MNKEDLRPKFSAVDAALAFDAWGCNCGPTALAAIAGFTLDEVRPHIPDFESKHYTNPTMMNAGLRALGVRFCKIGRRWPAFGLIRVQWEGPWTEPGVPIAARYRYTHWIGGCETGGSYGIFDVNALANGSGWVSRENWVALMVPFLCNLYPRATGKWHVTHGLQVSLGARG